jgi:hypothetical protein
MNKRALIVPLFAASLALAGPAHADVHQDCMRALMGGASPVAWIENGADEESANDAYQHYELRLTFFTALANLKSQLDDIDTLEVFLNAQPNALTILNRMRIRIRTQMEVYIKAIKNTDAEMLQEAQSACETVRSAPLPPRVVRRPPPGEGVAPPPVAQPQTPRPPPRTPPIDHGTSAVIQMEGEPVTSPLHDIWKAVSPGRIEMNGGNYDATYTWNELPQTIGPEGFDLVLKVVAHTKAGESVNTGIAVKGLVDFVKSGTDNTPVEQQVPASSQNGQPASASITVHIKPLKAYSPGQDVTIEVGAFYGPSVVYHYKPLRTEQ